MGFWAGVALGAGLMLVAVALTLGVGLVLYRMLMDSALGHAWREDWKETMRRWGIK